MARSTGVMETCSVGTLRFGIRAIIQQKACGHEMTFSRSLVQQRHVAELIVLRINEVRTVSYERLNPLRLCLIKKCRRSSARRGYGRLPSSRQVSAAQGHQLRLVAKFAQHALMLNGSLIRGPLLPVTFPKSKNGRRSDLAVLVELLDHRLISLNCGPQIVVSFLFKQSLLQGRHRLVGSRTDQYHRRKQDFDN